MKQIFIHGLGQTPASWKKTIMLLNAAAYSICPDLAAMCQEKEATYENLYAAFSEICNKLEEPVDLCGLSLGGVIALHYAIEHSEKVRSLALIAAQYKTPKKLLQVQNILFRFMPKAMFQQTGFGKAEFLQLCGTMMDLDLTGSIKNISCPALVICGEKDTANRNASVRLAELLPDAEFLMVPRVGHEINVEAPEKLVEALRSFYQRI